LDCDASLEQNYGLGLGYSRPNRVGIDNGTLTVRVLTTLTAPATSSIGFLAFIRGADDFEYANPREAIIMDSTDLSAKMTPSFFALQGAEKVDVVPTKLVFGTPPGSNENRYQQNFGECVASLRSLLQRSSEADTIVFQTLTASAFNIMAKYYSIMPYTPGFHPVSAWPMTASKMLAATGTAYFAACPMHPMPYITGMFLGYRGGANFTVTLDDQLNPLTNDVRVARMTSSLDENTKFAYVWGNSALTDSVGKRTYLMENRFKRAQGNGGMAITSQVTQNTMQFYLPDNKRFNFSFVNPANYIIGSSTDGTNNQGVCLTVVKKTSATSTLVGHSAQTEVGAGADFSCIYFLCCPTLDYFLAPTIV
jgi:hypothetical protein